MTKKYVNLDKLPIALVPFIVRDTYDYVHIPNSISVTSLIKPSKKLVLGSRVDSSDLEIDALKMVASRMGTAIHDSIESSWNSPKLKEMLRMTGVMSNKVIDSIKVNPKPEELNEDTVPVYMEQRRKKEFEGVTVHGKFDFIINGLLEDFKSTSVWAYINGRNYEDYQLQGSLYRWIMPDLITKDYMNINYIFTDFSAGMARSVKNYPSQRFIQESIPLLSLEETEAYVRDKLSVLRKYDLLDEEDIPRCSDEELWRSPYEYKYYKNPNNRTRSTKNFNNPIEAEQRLVDDGNVGIVVRTGGDVKACLYCDAFPICKQKDEYLESGELKLDN